MPQRPDVHIFLRRNIKVQRGVQLGCNDTERHGISGSTGRRTSPSVTLSTISPTDWAGIETNEVIDLRPTGLGMAACSLLNVTAEVSTSGGAGYGEGLRLVCERSEASCSRRTEERQ